MFDEPVIIGTYDHAESLFFAGVVTGAVLAIIALTCLPSSKP